MNNMKSKVKSPPLRKLSLSIGDFIRYWGFRRVHGAIWTQVYLSTVPVSCTDLTQRLGLSKALISPALEELCKHQLLYEVPSPNGKTKLYASSENINEVIRNVLKNREAKMLQQITKDFSSVDLAKNKNSAIDEQKLKALGEMISTASLMLEILIGQEDLLKFPMDINL